MNHTFEAEKQLPDRGNCVILSIWEIHRAKGGFTPLFHSEGSSSPSDERKEGDSNVRYISGLDSDRYTRCRPCEFDLSDLQGKKEIAATTTNSDGLPISKE